MSNENKQIIKLTYATRAAFVSATASVTDPIMCVITSEEPYRFGVKASGSYYYTPDATDALAVLTAAITTLQSKDTSLQSQINEIRAGGVSGESMVFAGRTAFAAVSAEFEAGDTIGPLSCVYCHFDHGGDVVWDSHIYLGAKFAATHSAGTVSVPSENFLYARGILGDDYSLRIYDTLENAADAGSAGWLAEVSPLPDMTPGIYTIHGISSGSPTNETVGYLYTREGLPMSSIEAAPFQIPITSRDFSFVRDNLVPGFTMNYSGRIAVENPGYERVGISVSIAQGENLLPNITDAGIIRDYSGPLSLIDLAVKVEVVDRYTVGTEKILFRTTVSFPSHHSTFSPDDLIMTDLAEIEASVIGSDFCFLEVSATGTDFYTTIRFIGAELYTCAGVTIQ
jgi:hypothetical protein